MKVCFHSFVFNVEFHWAMQSNDQNGKFLLCTGTKALKVDKKDIDGKEES